MTRRAIARRGEHDVPGPNLGYDLKYHPNFQWGITETWFNGTFEVGRCRFTPG
jgi:hypothetical protein